MALISCPDCRKPVSDQARSCPYCGCPVTVRVAQMQREEEEREAQMALQAQRRENVRMFFVVAGIILAVFVVGSIINSCNQASAVRNLYNVDGYSQNVTPGDVTAFSVAGKLTMTYSCQISAGKSATVNFVLKNITTSKVVWQKAVTCSSTGTPNGSDSVTVPDGMYDVGATIHGQATWSMLITISTATPTAAPSTKGSRHREYSTGRG